MSGYWGGGSYDRDTGKFGGQSSGLSGGGFNPNKEYTFRGGIKSEGTSKFDAAKKGASNNEAKQNWGIPTGDAGYWEEQAALAYQEEKSLSADDEAKYGSGSKYAGIYKKPDGSPATEATGAANNISAEAQNLAKAEEEIKKRAATGVADKSGGTVRVDTKDTELAKASLLGV